MTTIPKGITTLLYVDVKTMVRYADRRLDHMLYPVKLEPAVPWRA
jgi:hypothetical protein